MPKQYPQDFLADVVAVARKGQARESPERVNEALSTHAGPLTRIRWLAVGPGLDLDSRGGGRRVALVGTTVSPMSLGSRVSWVGGVGSGFRPRCRVLGFWPGRWAAGGVLAAAAV